MKNSTLFSLMAGLALTATTCGCQSVGPIARGQSPMPEVAPQELTYPAPAPAVHPGLPQTPHTAGELQAVQDHFQNLAGHHAYQTTHYHETVQAGPAGNCPQGYCPSHGHCPSGHCGRCGNGFDWYPKHHSSYSYSVPNDLKYPQQNQPGGAIVYPYYTHKGPSDFFRK